MTVINTPFISVIVPVFNGENYLKHAIDSVLAQKYGNLEVIIVDDGSTDETATLAKAFLDIPGFSYLHQENSGHGAALNTGIAHARGDYLAFVDHDDYWDPEKLSIQLEVFTRNPDLDIVYTHQQSFAENEAAEKLAFQRDPVPGYMPGTMLIRTSSFHNVGYFNTELRLGYFFVWYDLANLNGLKKHLIPKVLYHRRVHGKNLSIGSSNADYRDYFSALRAVRKQRD